MKLLRSGVIIVFVLTLFGSLAFGQSTFLVMSVKGKVEAREAGANKWKRVKVGMELSANTIVKTSYASYVKLMINGTRLAGIDENTEKSLSKFSPATGNGTQSKTNTILAYAARQMKQGDKSARGTEFGAVRGNMEVFNATFPKYAVMTPQPEFRVVDETQNEDYMLQIYDDEMNSVSSERIHGHTFIYPASGVELLPGKTYYWKATRIEDGATTDVQRFSILHPDTVAFIQSELVNLRAELEAMGADEVMHHLIRGVYFEQKNLFYDAYLEYLKTIELAPEVQEYKDMLSNLFLSLSLHNEEEFLISR